MTTVDSEQSLVFSKLFNANVVGILKHLIEKTAKDHSLIVFTSTFRRKYSILSSLSGRLFVCQYVSSHRRHCDRCSMRFIRLRMTLSTNPSLPQNRGIGEAIAQSLAKSHQDPLVLYATSRKGANLAFKTASETKVLYAKLDIADRESVENLASSVEERFGGVDVLINNAGVNVDGEYSAGNVRVTLDTNVRGTLQVRVIFFVFRFGEWAELGSYLPTLVKICREGPNAFSRFYHCQKPHGIDSIFYSSILFLVSVLYKN